MTTILGAAASGMVHHQAMLDTAANNLANVNTAGFKAVRALGEGTPDAAATPEDSRLGVATSTFDRLFHAGALQTSEDPLHFAITDGDVFFRVQDFDGSTVLTRLGLLGADGDGTITTIGGRLLEPPLNGPGLTGFAIDSFGVITGVDETGERQEVGQVPLVRVFNPQGLEEIGNGLYRETANSGPLTEGFAGDEGFGTLYAGALEGSNVDMAEEFTNIIIAQRAYQAAARTFSIGDQMLELATNLSQ
jgi:flagellar hook protein FlgE